MPENEKVCLLDLDGTLVDYEGQLRQDLRKIMSPPELLITNLEGSLHTLEDSAPHWKERMDLIKASPGWWESLPELEDGFLAAACAADAGFDIHVLTQGPRRAVQAWSQKFAWFQKHVQAHFEDAQITITRDKGLVYGRILIDDWPAYVTRWLEHRPRGLVIMPARPYNKDFTHPNVVKFQWGTGKNGERSNLDEVQAAMKAAFER